MAARSRKVDPSELDELRLREMLAGGDAVLDAVPRLAPGYMRPTHLRPLADLIARHAAGESIRAVVSAPPRHSKSETIAVGLAWLLFVRPTMRIALVSYSADLAEARSRRVRELAERAGVRIARDQRALASWRTMAGGEVRAVGVGGPLTGFGFDLVVLDDPIKNREEAESATSRDTLAGWFTGVLMTRVEPHGSVIVAAARWHSDDLMGRLIGDGWPSINLPAIDHTGGALWPERWPLELLREREREVGPFDWASLYLGMPRPRGGNLFSAAPVFYDRADLAAKLAAHTARLLIACDPAATARTSADYSVALVVAFHGRPGRDLTMDVVHMDRGQWLIPDLVERLAALQRRWRAPIAVESVGAFRVVADMLKRVNPGLAVAHVKAVTDKYTRIQPTVAAWSRGAIRLPSSAPWMSTFLGEIQSVTMTGADRHDDIADTLGIAWSCSGLAAHAEHRNRQRAAIHAALPFGA